MLSVTDIKKLTQVFATKQDLEKLATKVELREFRNDVMDKMDKVYTEVLNMREEQSAQSQRYEDLEQEISSAKKRVDQIEKIPVIAHQIKK